jgi:hypothetical protein
VRTFSRVWNYRVSLKADKGPLVFWEKQSGKVRLPAISNNFALSAPLDRLGKLDIIKIVGFFEELSEFNLNKTIPKRIPMWLIETGKT